MLIRQGLHHALTPLDDDDGVLEIGIEVQRVQLVERGLSRHTQTVGVDVHEGDRR
jgi:hypothetical protein